MRAVAHVVHEHVQPAQRRHRSGDRGRAAVGGGQVGRDAASRPAPRPPRSGCREAIDNARALGRQQLRGRQADARAATGHQHARSGQPEIHRAAASYDLRSHGDDAGPAGAPRRDRLEPRRALAGPHAGRASTTAGDGRREALGRPARRTHGDRCVYTSDLQRAVETAAIVADAHGPDRDPRSRRCARWTSARGRAQTARRSRQRSGRATPAGWPASPAGAAARPTTQMHAAVVAAVDRLAAAARRRDASSRSPTAAPSAPSPRTPPACARHDRRRIIGAANCSLTVVETGIDDRLALVTFNDIGHLVQPVADSRRLSRGLLRVLPCGGGLHLEVQGRGGRDRPVRRRVPGRRAHRLLLHRGRPAHRAERAHPGAPAERRQPPLHQPLRRTRTTGRRAA